MARAVELVFYDELPDEQIAATLGVSRRCLSRWKRRDDFRAALTAFADHRRQRAHEVLDATVEKAARTLRDLLDSENEQIRLRAAVEVLKVRNSGHEAPAAAPTQVEVQIANFVHQLGGVRKSCQSSPVQLIALDPSVQPVARPLPS